MLIRMPVGVTGGVCGVAGTLVDRVQPWAFAA
jgi:hypothetical protein